MKILRVIPILALVVIALAAQSQEWCSEPNLVTQSFPAASGTEASWKVCWRWEDGPGLIISHAFFRTSPKAPWIRVLWEMRVSQIFVPYHDNSNRFYDVSLGFTFVPLHKGDCPASAGGTVIGPGSEVCKQVHDRGIAWKNDSAVRRGEELVLWSALDAWNYNYIIEWVFRDDGMIIGRLGATAMNYPYSPEVTHTHDPIWRLDVDLDGFCCDTVMTMEHMEVIQLGVDNMTTLKKEAALSWNAQAYTTLHVVDKFLANGLGHQSGFHLMPVRYGAPLHDEDFSHNDYYVTRYRWNELLGDETPKYVDGEAIEESDVVLWYMGGVHHIYRDEDGRFNDKDEWVGNALLMSTEFQFKPMNLFAGTPLYP